MVLSIVMCAYLLGRIVGGRNMSAFTAMGATGVIPKETVKTLGPAGRIAGKSATPQDRAAARRPLAALLFFTEDPVAEVTAVIYWSDRGL